MNQETQNYHILLVEDDAPPASMVADFLSPLGFDVSIEGRGDAAVDRITRENPDAVVLGDDRVHVLVIGMRLEGEVDANIKTLSGELTYTRDDRALLAELGAGAFDCPASKAMRAD